MTVLTYVRGGECPRRRGAAASRPRCAEAARSSTRRAAPAAAYARPPATSRSPTSSTPTSSRAAPPTSPFPRRCPRRRSSSAPASRPAPSTARPASRRTATWRACAAASTTRPSTWWLETTPLVGSLGRACYAPCEDECTRGELEGPLPIRRLKRFIADRRYGQAEPKTVERPEPNGKKVAVVGSGPAGLTAAWQLARKGYAVKIFEAASTPGGMLSLGIPAYRLPNDVVADDVANVTAIGVEIATDSRIDDVAALRRDGFDAVLVATGTHKSVSLRVPGEDLEGVQSALEFLRAVKLGEAVGSGRQARAGGRRRQRRHRRGAQRSPTRRGLGRPGQPGMLRGDAGPRFRGRRGPRRGHHAARRLGHRPLHRRGPRAGRAAQGLHLRVRSRRALPPRVRRDPAQEP